MKTKRCQLSVRKTFIKAENDVTHVEDHAGERNARDDVTRQTGMRKLVVFLVIFVIILSHRTVGVAFVLLWSFACNCGDYHPSTPAPTITRQNDELYQCNGNRNTVVPQRTNAIRSDGPFVLRSVRFTKHDFPLSYIGNRLIRCELRRKFLKIGTCKDEDKALSTKCKKNIY